MRNFISILLFLLTPIYSFAATGAIVTVDKQGWRIDANISGSGPDTFITTSSSSFVELTNANWTLNLNPGSSPAEIPCSGTNPSTGVNCSVGNESYGIVFEPPTAGVYEICGTPITWHRYGAAGTAEMGWKWNETPNNSQTIIQDGLSSVAVGMRSNTNVESTDTLHTSTVCNTFTFSDTSKKTLRLMYTADMVNGSEIRVATGQLNFGNASPKTRISVRRRVEFSDAVKFTNLVTTGQQTGVKIEAARIANNGTASVTQQTGFIQSVSRIAMGRIDVTFVGGKFSATPSCTCSGETAVYCYLDATLGLSATSATIRTLTDANANFDANVALNCVGF